MVHLPESSLLSSAGSDRSRCGDIMLEPGASTWLYRTSGVDLSQNQQVSRGMSQSNDAHWQIQNLFASG